MSYELKDQSSDPWVAPMGVSLPYPTDRRLNVALEEKNLILRSSRPRAGNLPGRIGWRRPGLSRATFTQ